jgi:hypothetical protein
MDSNAHPGTKLHYPMSLWHSKMQSFSCELLPTVPYLFSLSNMRSDTHDLSLSPYQQQFFQGWIRAADAVPPRAAFPNNSRGIGPLMSSSRNVDLVQDAASDCSVVTSLCAAIARAERGHDEVSVAKETMDICN